MLEDKVINASKARDIIAAAYQVMLEDGFAGASIRNIAGRAGVSKYMIHYYFEDKETLMVEVVKEVIRGIDQAIKGIFERYPTNRERIEKGVRDWWEGFTKDTGPLSILQDSAIQGRRIPEINRRIVVFYREVVEDLAEAIMRDDDSGLLTREKARAAVIHLFSTLDGLALQYMRDPELTDYDLNLDILVGSLGSLISRESPSA
ncbi:MAG: TetR/AcrR family transcriptional regulator [Actinobacteria bacterium]|nr:TetR/AcrR family transcriptional regulator [Actinomycetota bacterium]